jgi:hypothetical protein
MKDTPAMKIHNIEQILKDLYPEAKPKAQPSADKEFNSILQKSVGNSKKDVMETHRTTFINPLKGVQMNPSSMIDRQSALDRIENLIDLLDHYRQRLADPGSTLKHIDPIISQIDREAEHLVPILESLPEGEELKNIINQTLVTASLEVTKFYRGDYIAS